MIKINDELKTVSKNISYELLLRQVAALLESELDAIATDRFKSAWRLNFHKLWR
jgi:hypothetical protein